MREMLAKAPMGLGKKKRCQQSPKAESAPTIESAYQIYEGEHVRVGRWRTKTQTDQRQMLRIFLELVGGNCPLGDLNRQFLLAVREKIFRLPPNLTKSPKLRGKTLSEILVMKSQKGLPLF